MTMIKKSEKADKKQLLIKLSAVIVALLLVFGVYSLMSSGDHESGVNKAQVRSSTNSKSVEVNSNPGDESEEGRLITFDLAKLKSGGKGTIKVRTRPSWAPIGVGQFHELVDAGFFDECRFFRVVKNFIVQFGINGNPQVQKEWRTKVLQDDPVIESNKRGTLTFATSGPNTRTTQMFINTKDNKFLDAQGFSPIGEIVEGMEFVDEINDEYKELPNQGKIQQKGNAYLEKEFPNLSYIEFSKGG